MKKVVFCCVLLFCVAACERKNRNNFVGEGRASSRIKCWSGGQQIFDRPVSYVHHYESFIKARDADGDYLLHADCIVYPNP